MDIQYLLELEDLTRRLMPLMEQMNKLEPLLEQMTRLMPLMERMNKLEPLLEQTQKLARIYGQEQKLALLSEQAAFFQPPAGVTNPPQLPETQPRPTAVKPTMQEVLACQQSDSAFAYVLREAEARLGRPLTHGDQETLLYLYATAGMPAAVLKIAIQDAVEQDKRHMRYIERMVLDWVDAGIDTVNAAEAHIRRRRQRQEAWERLHLLLALKVQRPTAAAVNAAVLWLEEWRLPPALIQLAYARCVERTGKFQVSYMSKMLDAWRVAGYRTPEEVAAGEAVSPAAATAAVPKKSRAAHRVERSSMDLDKYEEMVRGYVPE